MVWSNAKCPSVKDDHDQGAGPQVLHLNLQVLHLNRQLLHLNLQGFEALELAYNFPGISWSASFMLQVSWQPELSILQVYIS